LGGQTDRELLRRHRARSDLEHRLRGRDRQYGDTVNIRTTPEITIRPYVKGQTLTVENPDKPKIQLLIDKGEYFACVEDDVDKVQSDINLMDTWSKDASER
jgi:hypothetical protein